MKLCVYTFPYFNRYSLFLYLYFCVDYLESVECFRHFDNNIPPCDEAAQRIYLDYRHFITRFDVEDEPEEQYSEEEAEDSISYKEPYCM